MTKSEICRHIVDVLKPRQAVKAAYLFGSQVTGKTGPLSDIDVAIYIEGLQSKELVDLRLSVLAELTRALQTDRVDLVILNQTDKPALKYAIITTGQLVFERDESRVAIEPKIMNEYFDYRTMLRRHGLTGASEGAII